MISDQQTLIAVLVAAFAAATAAFVTTKIRKKDFLGQVREAFGYAFEPPRRMPYLLLTVSIGLPLTVFYLVALAADQSGTFNWGALQFLTAGDVLGAVLLGFGTATTIALNIGVKKSRGTKTTLTVTGNLAAIVPTLLCTSLLPSGFALLGASAPVIVQRFQYFQAVFAHDSAQFVGMAVAVVLISLWLAIGNLATGCKARLSPE